MYLAAYQRGFMIIIANQYVDLPAKKVFGQDFWVLWNPEIVELSLTRFISSPT